MTANILYITYDGLTDPLGRSQVLPYLIGLGRLGYRFTVLSCEKPERAAREGAKVRRICDEAGIVWRPLKYHKQPPVLSGVYDRIVLEREAVRLHRRDPFDIVHCRSYIPAAAGRALKRRFGVRFLFDMRGYWPEEKVEAGSWPQTNPVFRAVYAYMKRLEAALLRDADHIISLTEASRVHLNATAPDGGGAWPITVIPCCADFEHFRIGGPGDRASGRRALGIDADAKVLVYLGSIGAWYMLDEMLEFFRVFLRSHRQAVLLFVTHEPAATLIAAAAARGIPADRIVARPASREEVPAMLAAADAGLFFIRPVPSKRSSSPTKMAELMALGLPIVTNAGVGDVAEIVADTGCGTIVERFDEEGYAAAIARMDEVQCSADEIRAGGLRWFDVEEGVRRYDRVYRSLAMTDR